MEDEVYEDEAFRETLADAVRSLKVGSVWNLATKVGPLIRPPRGELARGMKELEPGESWLVMPERVSDNKQLYRPGVKWNVRPGGFTHCTELFGPVLGVMRYRRLEDAIGIVNATGYGLTSGLESLDDREQEIWRDTIRAGNLYINRPTTGAIVLRQPFGGVGSSAYGPGVKAGGPHYVLPLLDITDAADPELTDKPKPDELAVLMTALSQCLSEGTLEQSLFDSVSKAIGSQRLAVEQEFGGEHDTLGILGQDNIRRYKPLARVRSRLGEEDSLRDVLIAVCASVAAGSSITVSHDESLDRKSIEVLDAVADTLPRRMELVEESTEDLTAAIRQGEVDRLRVLSKSAASDEVLAACSDAFVSVVVDPVVLDGYVEVLRYLNEQSLSFSYHRYGNLGRRTSDS